MDNYNLFSNQLTSAAAPPPPPQVTKPVRTVYERERRTVIMLDKKPESSLFSSVHYLQLHCKTPQKSKISFVSRDLLAVSVTITT